MATMTIPEGSGADHPLLAAAAASGGCLSLDRPSLCPKDNHTHIARGDGGGGHGADEPDTVDGESWERCLSQLIAALQRGTSDCCQAVTSLYLSLDLFHIPFLLAEEEDANNNSNNNDDNERVSNEDEDRKHEQRQERFQRLRSDLLEALACGALPRLQSLRVYSSASSGSSGSPLSADVLARILRTHFRTLQTLSVTRCLHLATAQDALVLAQALQDHPTLVRVQLLDLAVDHHDKDGGSLNPIVTALASLRQLESVDISLAATPTTMMTTRPQPAPVVLPRPTNARHGSSNHKATVRDDRSSTRWGSDGGDVDGAAKMLLPPATLQNLVDSCLRLTDLSLWNCGLQDVHLEVLAAALLAHETLVFVSLRKHPEISNRAWCRFYRSLEHCYCLQSLYNDHADGLNDCHPALPHHGGSVAPPSERPNANDDDHWTVHNTTSAVAAAELYLGLNQCGRGALLRPAAVGVVPHDGETTTTACHSDDDRETWCRLLDTLADSPPALYAMLCQNPALVRSHPP